MRNEARGDVWKVWLYAAAAVALGAWISPLLYNAGKALAEVSSSKTTNGFLEWLANVCRSAEFPRFYQAAIILAAALLFFPWMEWIHARRGEAAGGAGPWQVRLPDGARILARGQPLRNNPQALRHACAGFLVVTGLLLSLGMALTEDGRSILRNPAGDIVWLAVKTAAGALMLAALMEVFFRGIAMGIFLRAMRPAVALGMSAAFFALALSVIPPPGVNVADPDASGTGFELLGNIATRLADWRHLSGNLAPLLALGGLLGYARWRTQSLWLPIGLHAGWLFSKGMLTQLGTASHAPQLGPLQQGVVPLIALLVAGVLAHYLTPARDNEETARS